MTLKYSIDASLREVTARVRLRRKRERKNLCILAAATVMLFAVFVSALEKLAGRLAPEEQLSVFGAFLLPGSAGGYVLAGVIAFILGVAFTLLCLRQQMWKDYLGKASEESSEKPNSKEELP